MTRIFLVPLVILLVGAFVFAGCAAPAPTPAPPAPALGPEPTPIPTPVAPVPTPEKPIEIKFATWDPPPSGTVTRYYEPWAKEIEKRTNGRVKITFYLAQALGKGADDYGLTVSGIADMAKICPSWTPGVFPRSEAITLPMMFPSSTIAACAFWELAEKYMLDTEYSKVKLINVFPTGVAQLWTTAKQVRTLEELKGMKLAATSPAMTKTTEKLGAIPVFMTEADIYTSLERGLLDGRWHEWQGGWTWKAYEVTKYRTANVGLMTNINATIMNLDCWNSLPSDIQAIFDELGGFEGSRSGGALFDDLADLHLTKIKDYDRKVGNPEIYYLPDDERARWAEAVTPLHDEWAEEMEAMGLPGRAILEDIYAWVVKYSK